MTQEEKEILTPILKDYLEVLYAMNEKSTRLFEILFPDHYQDITNLDQDDKFELEKKYYDTIDIYTSDVRNLLKMKK